MKQTQKEAVFTAINNVLAEHDVRVPEGANYGKYMTREYRAIVNGILFAGFMAGKIDMETPELLQNESDLRAYVSGLQSNWLRKDKRLNGGTTYKPANPGSRAGTGDDQLKALRQLHSTVSTPQEKADIQSHIDKRVKEINVAKNKTNINISALPPAIRAKYASYVA